MVLDLKAMSLMLKAGIIRMPHFCRHQDVAQSEMYGLPFSIDRRGHDAAASANAADGGGGDPLLAMQRRGCFH